MISAALTGADQAITVRWSSLLKRLADAADARNQIAHARTVHNAGLVNVPFGNKNTTGKAIPLGQKTQTAMRTKGMT